MGISIKNKKKNTKTEFGNLEPGETFKYKDRDAIYIAVPASRTLEDDHHYNAVDVETGVVEWLDDNEKVSPVNLILALE